MCRKTEILSYFESLEEVKTPPSILADILCDLFKDRSSTARKRITLSRDPGLTTRMLRVADLSSPASDTGTDGSGRPGESCGVNGSRWLILSIAVYNQLSQYGYTESELFSEVWRHSLQVANAAQAIAHKSDPSLVETAYVCGLLHDLGHIMLLRHFPKEASAVRNEVIGGRDLHEVERGIFGTDHQEVGFLVAGKWNMPGIMREVIRDHHAADQNAVGRMSPLSLMTVVADNLSPVYRESLGAREEEGPKVRMLEECCRRLGISLESVSGIYSILPKHVFKEGKENDVAKDDDIRNYGRMNIQLFDLYSGLACMFRERQQISRQLLQEKYVEGTWESLTIALSTISHYINNSMSIVSGESEILKHVYEKGDKEAALARIPDITRAITKTSKKIAVLLEELSKIAGPDELQYFKNSKAIDIKKILEERLETETRTIP